MRHLALVAALLIGTGHAALADVVITGHDNGKTITVPLGEPLVVKLTGEHESGYYWRLDADLTPELILSGRTTDALDVPGSREVTTFTFETSAPGTVLFRASELKAGAPIPRGDSDIEITIKVEP